jgi:hypothetical protein
MDLLIKSHKHYGTLLIALVLAVIVVTLLKGPKPVFQRIVAVLVDINLVVGLATAWRIAPKSFSLLHPVLVLGAVGLLHASAKSDNAAKVIRCFSIALVLLIAAWAFNAPWGKKYVGEVWMVNFPGQTAPATPIAQ